jgi:hypothetical protein
MSAAGASLPFPSVAEISHQPTWTVDEAIARSFMASRIRRTGSYVARLRDNHDVEILSQEAYEGLPLFERSVEGSNSDEQCGTFRTLTALGFKQADVEEYLDSVALLGVRGTESTVELPPFRLDLTPAEREHFDLCFTVIEFHNRVRSAIQTFGRPPLQQS